MMKHGNKQVNLYLKQKISVLNNWKIIISNFLQSILYLVKKLWQEKNREKIEKKMCQTSIQNSYGLGHKDLKQLCKWH